MGGIVFDEIDFAAADLGIADELEANTDHLKNIPEKSGGVFYGALICECGIYKGNVLMLMPNEIISVFVDENGNIKSDNAEMHKKYCMISYDKKYEEYLVQPREKCVVFLNSGQPLGKERTYCIPRGMRLILGNKKTSIILG